MTQKKRHDSAWYEKRLRESLKQVPETHLDSVDWDRMERAIFAGISETPHKLRVAHSKWLPAIFRTPSFGIPFAGTVVVLAALLIIVTLSRWQPGGSAVARLVAMNGEVMQSRSSESWRPAWASERLRGGVTFKTAEKASMVAVLGSGTGFSLSGNSNVFVGQLNGRGARLQINRGSLVIERIAAAHKHAITVTTPSASVVALGTLFKVDVIDAKTTLVSLMHGSVSVGNRSSAQKEQTVSAPAQITVTSDSIQVIQTLAPTGAVQGVLDTLAALGLSVSKPSEWSTGFVLVSSQPSGAQVIVDGRIAGATPLVLEQPIGKHVISVRSKGYARYEQEVDLSPGSPRTLIVSLVSLDDDSAIEHSLTGPALHSAMQEPRPFSLAMPSLSPSSLTSSVDETTLSKTGAMQAGGLESVEQPIDTTGWENMRNVPSFLARFVGFQR